MLDQLIRGAMVYDGSGALPEKRDVGILNGKLVLNGLSGAGAKEITDAEGLALSPGFIDSHSHSDLRFARDPLLGCKLRQGITTEITGCCGSCAFPTLSGSPEEKIQKTYNNTFFRDFETMYSYGKTAPLGTNLYATAGHGRLRSQVIGPANRPAAPGELETMKQLLRQAMEQGAMGLSTGFAYTPGMFAPEDEIVQLLKIVSEYGGIYTTHIRSESDYVEESVDEAIRQAEAAGVALQISHLKAMYPKNWHKMDSLLERISRARERGMDIAFDVYPYSACSTYTASCLPPSVQAMGYDAYSSFLRTKEGIGITKEKILHPTEVFENPLLALGGEKILITKAPETPEAIGKTIREYGELYGLDDIEACIDLILRNKAAVFDVRFAMSEENLTEAIRHPLCLVGTDGLYYGYESSSHPRAFGTFPRYLGRYVRDEALLSPEEGIHRITGAAAERFGLQNKGFIREGFDADLVLFDPQTILDGSTYANPLTPNRGIETVYVAGKAAVRKNELTGAANGKICRRHG